MNEDFRIITPFSGTITGEMSVPGDKSISHRVAMLAGVATGESVASNFLLSEDCLNTLGAMEMLGVQVERDGANVKIKGLGGTLSEPSAVLDLGNSGTGIRLLAGLLAGQGFSVEMTGDESLCSRPMGRIKKPLELMGADVHLTGEKGCAPIRIEGAVLKGIEYELPVASAQVKSCALLAGLFADGVTTVVEPKPTRDHTEKLLSAMGADIEVSGLTVKLKGSGQVGPSLKAGNWDIPGDFSSAAFWMAAAACREGSDLLIRDIGLNPRRTAFMDVLRRMGADIECRKSSVEGQTGWEEVGDIRVKGGSLKGTEIGGEEIPNLIDELPLVAIVGALAEGQTVIRDAAELRVKESDRISTVAKGLLAFGVPVEEKPDGMVVTGAASVSGGGEIDSYGDHRIAMGMAVLGLFADAPVKILHTDCVATSYPGFWEMFRVKTQSC
jgi:3-phosphoshikimate 1-carboxyvinyltransferase